MSNQSVLVGLLSIAMLWGPVGAVVPAPSLDQLPPPLPPSVCTPQLSTGPVSVAPVCASPPSAPSASLPPEVRAAIASTHDHDERYYTEQESDARFLGIDAKARDSDRLDGLDSAAFARAGHSHDDRYFTRAESEARFLLKGEKAADADRLDGRDGAQYLRSLRLYFSRDISCNAWVDKLNLVTGNTAGAKLYGSQWLVANDGSWFVVGQAGDCTPMTNGIWAFGLVPVDGDDKPLKDYWSVRALP